MAQINDILQRVHVKLTQSSEYPDPQSEEWLIYVAYADDAISMWENLVSEGFLWDELFTTEHVTFSGTGSDPVPENFLAFANNTVCVNGTEYRVIKRTQAQMCSGMEPVIWTEGRTIRTMPALSGTHPFSYIRKATRYITGTEPDPIDMSDPKMIEHFVLARAYANDNDTSGYNIAMTDADEALKKMQYQFLT